MYLFSISFYLKISKAKTHISSLSPPQCVDITFANPEDVAEVNSSNCFNSSDIGFNNVYTMTEVLAPDLNTSSTSGALSRRQLGADASSPMQYFTLATLAATLTWAML